jgi:hypothetical protein
MTPSNHLKTRGTGGTPVRLMGRMPMLRRKYDAKPAGPEKPS